MPLPETFIKSIKKAQGFDPIAFEKLHLSGDQLTSIRLNLHKISKTPFTASGHPLEKVSWVTEGYYLPERPSFTIDPLFHAGAYYVQEASSMFLEEVLRQTTEVSQPLKFLDLCAAPGGKSTLIQSVMSKDSLLVSNEVIKTRVNILAENITKWGASNVIVTNNDPKDFRRLPEFFDVLMVDAPCSGSGLFRKEPAAVNEWSEQNVQLCSQRQQRILADCIGSLKETGTLIYSTCSYSTEEDEAIADWLVETYQMKSLRLSLDPSWGIVETRSPDCSAYGYRFYPDKVKGEGFFIAAFKKTQETTFPHENVNQSKKEKNFNRSKNKEPQLTAAEMAVLSTYLKEGKDVTFIRQQEEVLAIPNFILDDLSLIQSNLYIKKAGIKMGALIRGVLIPDHELAVSNMINGKIARVEVDEQTALNYLRRHEIKINSPLKDWVLISYRQLPLGWIKILPGRVNNYYPKEWRILNK